MQVPPPTRTSKGAEGRRSLGSMAGVLRHSLAPLEDGSPEHTSTSRVLWQMGEPSGDGGTAVSSPRELARPRLTLKASSGRNRSRVCIGPSGHGSTSVSDVLRLQREGAQEQGRAIHACFQAVGWLEDGVPDTHTLREMITQACPRRSPDEAWIEARIAQFQRYLAEPEIAQVLARPSLAARYRREVPLLVTRSHGVQLAIIDRLILFLGDSGEVTSAQVIDFKTDKEAAPGRLVDRYQGQLRDYAGAVAATYGIDPHAVSMKLVELEASTVSEVPAEGPG